MKRFISLLFFVSMSPFSFGQDGMETITGTVSFVTSNNVYLKFDDTEPIEVGAVLKFNGSDCLQVTDKSSISVVCSILNHCSIQKGDQINYTITSKETNVETDLPKEDFPKTSDELVSETEMEKTSLYEEKIRGRVSVSSYDLFSNIRDDRHRIMGRFSMDAQHLNNSKFSIQTYLNYRNITAGPDYGGRTSILNVYNLNTRFDATPSLSVTAGRAINPKASSLGANDGVYVEKYFGDFYVGAIGGFRPDFEDYGFNSDLLQYGAYVGYETEGENGSSQTTLGALEQTNSGNTDRRFIYLQHYSTIDQLSLFGSMELDIFGFNGNETRLTNLYLSARYRFSRAVNLMISYDARKRIYYYETFQTDIEQLLDDDLARQGIRIRLNVRPTKILWLGASYSSRFQSDNQNQSNNLYGYASLTKIPGIGGRIYASYNRNESNYLTSNVASISHSREFFKNKLYTEIYFRSAQYTYENSLIGKYQQNYYGLNLSYRISRTWQLSVLGEYATLDEEQSYRFYTRLIKRFYSKKK
ncbi:MAG: hypothetical protein R2773_04940 [Flavobacteriaceae bacterium]